MCQRIALFNHKDNWSKTTTAFNLGWMLASKDKRVLLVDANPQSNLTELITDEQTAFGMQNIGDGLAPAFEARMKLLKPIECITIAGQENLFLLPGHIKLSEHEALLSLAQELSASNHTLQNLPGSISYLIDKTAESLDIDYVLIDTDSGLSSINRNLLMTSHYFIVPTTPSYFSVAAIESLTNILPKWHAWSHRIQKLSAFRAAVYPFPQITPKFLGMVIQKSYNWTPVSLKWPAEIEKTVTGKFYPALKDKCMVIPQEFYTRLDVTNYTLAFASDFKTVVAPDFTHAGIQADETKMALETLEKQRDELREVFSDLAEKIINLTAYADSH